MIRILYLLWVLVFVILALVAFADAIFGEKPFMRSVGDLLPRLATAFLWPLALLTPRGRFLLWRRWRQP
jgi:hypothetical protein